MEEEIKISNGKKNEKKRKKGKVERMKEMRRRRRRRIIMWNRIRGGREGKFSEFYVLIPRNFH